MKRKVVLTETKLRKVVKNIITEILVNKAYNKFYSDIPEDVYKKLTSVDNTRGKHLGPYAKWVIELYRNGNFDLNDINKTKKYISVFERMSKAGKLKGVDINNFESLDDMYSSIKDYLGKETITKGEKIRKQKDEGIERIYEDSEWFVLSLITFEASLLYGANTKWCTASKDNPDEFKKYIDQGPLYVLINKKTKEKYQFHFESDFFVDKLDEDINVRSLELPNGLVNAIAKGDLKKENYFKYDFVGKFINGFAKVQRNGKINFIDKDGKLLLKQWFDWVGDFEDGFARVKLNNKWNLINMNGEILFKQWFDYINNLYDGIAKVKLDNKGYNLINQKGDILYPNQWFKYMTDFVGGFARVHNKEKMNFINQNGEVISKQWFDDVDRFNKGFVGVRLDGKGWNFMNQNGKILFPNQWFDKIDRITSPLVVKAEINGKEYEVNLIDRTITEIN